MRCTVNPKNANRVGISVKNTLHQSNFLSTTRSKERAGLIDLSCVVTVRRSSLSLNNSFIRCLQSSSMFSHWPNCTGSHRNHCTFEMNLFFFEFQFRENFFPHSSKHSFCQRLAHILLLIQTHSYVFCQNVTLAPTPW